jgi:ribosomal protein S18 acetylase RimI-like enzyme
VTIIRRATIDDVDAIVRVHDQSRRETYGPIFGAAYVDTPLDEQRSKWRRALAGPGIVHVAVGVDNVVGFGHALNGTLTTLYVLASHHRQGLGRDLLRALAVDMRAQGHDELRFNVLPQNTNAVGFYEAQGARLLGRVTVEEHGATHDDLVYVLPIGVL